MAESGQPKGNGEQVEKKWYNSLPGSKFGLIGLAWVLGFRLLIKSTLMRRYPDAAVVAFCALTVALLILAIVTPAKTLPDDEHQSDGD
jgi:hypothetical protein